MLPVHEINNIKPLDIYRFQIIIWDKCSETCRVLQARGGALDSSVPTKILVC